MSIVFHNDPFTPFDRPSIFPIESLGTRPGIRRSVAIPTEYLPTAVDAARLRVGARTLPVDQWVSEPDDDWGPSLAMKQQLIRDRYIEVVGYDEIARDACEEASRGVLLSLNLSESEQEGIDSLLTPQLQLLMTCASCFPMNTEWRAFAPRCCVLPTGGDLPTN